MKFIASVEAITQAHAPTLPLKASRSSTRRPLPSEGRDCFAAPYERSMAAASEALLRAFESPPVTRLEASRGEIIVDRADFPEASPRPGLPAGDLHFNFVLLCALFAMTPRPLSPGNFGRDILGAT